MSGGVNMCEAQIYIKKQKKTETNTVSRGGVVSQLGGLYPPPQVSLADKYP